MILVVFAILVLALMASNRYWFGRRYVEIRESMCLAWLDYSWWVREYLMAIAHDRPSAVAADQILKTEERLISPLPIHKAELDLLLKEQSSYIATLATQMKTVSDRQQEAFQGLFSNADALADKIKELTGGDVRNQCRTFAKDVYDLMTDALRGGDGLAPFYEMQASARTIATALTTCTARAMPWLFLV